jgi:hypothetical protein
LRCRRCGTSRRLGGLSLRKRPFVPWAAP